MAMAENAELVVIQNGKDADGFPIQTTTKKKVFVREKSANRAEFYEALRSGVTVRTILEVRQEDYDDATLTVDGKRLCPSQIEYDGETYSIVRAYKPGKSMIELTCR